MTITVEFYGVLKHIAKTDRVEIQIDDLENVEMLVAHVIAKFPALEKAMRGVAVAVDERIVARDTPLHAPCTVALLPPVSGGAW